MKNRIFDLKPGFNILCAARIFAAGVAATIFAAGMAFAGDRMPDDVAAAQDGATFDTTVKSAALSAGSENGSEGSRLQVGMSIEEAIELLGSDPDSETEIGAACGVLDILSWDEDGTRIIGVDGTVTSIVEDGTIQR